MKKERQDAILSLIAREEIPTQELLRERVAAMGFEVTQATLSRDIRELHLVKQRRSGKRASYSPRMSHAQLASPAPSRMSSLQPRLASAVIGPGTANTSLP